MTSNVVQKAEFLLSILNAHQQKMVKVELRFTAKYSVLSSTTLQNINRDLMWLLKTERLSYMTFSELQQHRGILLLMSMILQFANVGM